MTIRRAPASGTCVRRIAAGLQHAGYPAALLAGALLLPLPTAQAATRSHHVAVQSAGKAQAHVLHEAAARPTHSSAKSSSRGMRRVEAPEHASRKPSKNPAPASKHAKQHEDTRHEDAKRSTKGHAGRKRHEAVPVDDPQPVRRAQTTRRERDSPQHLAYREAPPQPRPAPVRAPQPVVLPGSDGIPGNVARNLARHAAQVNGQPMAADDAEIPSTFTTGVSHPQNDDEDVSPRASVKAPSSSRTPVPIVLGRSNPYLTAAVTAAPPQVPQRAPEAVDGFGGEVDFHAAGAHLSALKPEPIAPPQGTPAEQARELREAAEAAAQPMFVPLYNRDGKLMVPPPLKGSRAVLVHQNQMADDAGLSRIRDDADLNRMRRTHLLVDLPETASLRVNEGLPENRRAARPWAVHFATDIANAFYAHFGEPLQINSAVRTVAYQVRLQRVNGNAAATHGDGASPHLTGQALDFGKRGMSVAQLGWMRNYLMPLIDAGKIDVEEEFQQACFHISVYASYVPAHRHTPVRTEVAQTTRPAHTHASAPTAVDEDDMH